MACVGGFNCKRARFGRVICGFLLGDLKRISGACATRDSATGIEVRWVALWDRHGIARLLLTLAGLDFAIINRNSEQLQ